MRKFSSYGPVSTKSEYYVPRKELLEKVQKRLMGDSPEEDGHYITVWAPRQTGKTWLLMQAKNNLKSNPDIDAIWFSMEPVKGETSPVKVLNYFCNELADRIGIKLPVVESWEKLQEIFTKKYLKKPLILIIDEFDSLEEEVINQFANAFRNIYIDRRDDPAGKTGEKKYLLHSVALIGVRTVLGIENVKGSPFNVQRSIHIPDLTFEEVKYMYDWYQKESGQTIQPEVVERIFYESKGHPGLISWFGELVTETYNKDTASPITLDHWNYAYKHALYTLPNNTIINIISKSKVEPYRGRILDLFQTDEKVRFSFDNKELNYLYMNGIIDIEESAEDGLFYARFANPFIQKRLFNYFSDEIFNYMGQLTEPFKPAPEVFDPAGKALDITNLLRLYQEYLRKNREWLFKNVPRRSDMRIFEAVYHFNLYRYLMDFLSPAGGKVFPEFPTGNGKIDLLIEYHGSRYGLELKSFTNDIAYRKALAQAAKYGKQLGLNEVTLVFFVEQIDDRNREKYQEAYKDPDTGVMVHPRFIQSFAPARHAGGDDRRKPN